MDIVYTHEMSTTRRGTRYSGRPHALVVQAPVVQAPVVQAPAVQAPVVEEEPAVDAPVGESCRGHGTRSRWVVGLSATILAILAFLMIPRHAKESFNAKEPPKVEAVNTVGKILLQLGAPHLSYSKELHPSINDLKTVYETAFGGTDQEFECYMKTADEKLLFFVTLTRYHEQKVFQYEVQFNHQQQFQGLIPYVAPTTPKHSPVPGKTSSIVAAFPSLSTWVTPRHAHRDFDPDALCGVRIGHDKKITLYGSDDKTVEKVKEILLKLKGSEGHGKPDEIVVEKVAMGFLYVHFRPFFDKVKVAAQHYGVPVATMLAIVVALAFGARKQADHPPLGHLPLQEREEAIAIIDGIRGNRVARELLLRTVHRRRERREVARLEEEMRLLDERNQIRRRRRLGANVADAAAATARERTAAREQHRVNMAHVIHQLQEDLQHEGSPFYICMAALGSLFQNREAPSLLGKAPTWFSSESGGKKTKKTRTSKRGTRKNQRKQKE